MRTLVDLPEPDVEALDQLARRRRTSRAKVIRQAVSNYLAEHVTNEADKAFGLWGDRKMDGLEYQRPESLRMVKALFDTNILIDHLNNIPEAREELGRYEGGAISIVTWMEVMVGAPEVAAAGTKAFLAGFDIIGLDDQVAEAAVKLRQAHRIRLPDAVIWASARTHGLLLVTRNSKDFAGNDPGIRIPYTLA